MYETRRGIELKELLESCFSKPFHELAPLFDEAFKLTRTNFSNVITFSIPGMVYFNTPFYKATNPARFPAVSVTGNRCHLNCKHCGGQLLKTMIPAITPQKLFEVCTKIKAEGGKGCLISGGAQTDGAVPLLDFLPAIKRVKQELDLEVVVHTGIVSPKLAAALAETEIDAALIDVIGSNETIRSVYHLNQTIDAFDTSLTLLEKNNIPTVPHILVGLHYGILKGEGRALQLISSHNPAAIIIIALTPLENTAMAHLTPPFPQDIARVMLASRLLMINTPLFLGCARPFGELKSEIDILAIKAGVNGIAYPSEAGYNYAKMLGLNIKFSESCCALMYNALKE